MRHLAVSAVWSPRFGAGDACCVVLLLSGLLSTQPRQSHDRRCLVLPSFLHDLAVVVVVFVVVVVVVGYCCRWE